MAAAAVAKQGKNQFVSRDVYTGWVSLSLHFAIKFETLAKPDEQKRPLPMPPLAYYRLIMVCRVQAV